MRPRSPVPLGVMLEWTLSLPNTEDDRTKHSSSHTQNLVALDLLYTGRSDCRPGSRSRQWGSDRSKIAARTATPVESSDQRQRLGALIVLRYFW